MAGVKIRVKIEEIRPLKQVTEKFSKAELIGVVEGEWPEEFLFEFPNDKSKMLEDLIEGTYVTIHANLRTNRVAARNEDEDDKFFLSLQGWKVEA
jgi:hypothetical protein